MTLDPKLQPVVIMRSVPDWKGLMELDFIVNVFYNGILAIP